MRAVPICYRCGIGFDLVEGTAPVCPKCRSRWTPASNKRGSPIGDFFLTVGLVICFLGCGFAVLKTLYGLWTLEQVASIVSTSTASSVWLIALILVDGFIWFCLSAALLVVFARLRDL